MSTSNTIEADEKDMVVGILALRDDEELTPENFNSLLSVVKNSRDSSTLARLSFQAIEKCCNRDSKLVHESITTLSALMQSTEDRTTKITAAQAIKRICRLIESGEIDLFTTISDTLTEIVASNSSDVLICRPLQDALLCFKQNKQLINKNEEPSTATSATLSDSFTAQQPDTVPLEEVTPECLMILSEIKPSRWKDLQRRMNRFYIPDVTSPSTIQKNMMLSIVQMAKWEEFAGIKSEEPTKAYTKLNFDRLLEVLKFLVDEKFWMREGFTFEKDPEKPLHRVVQSGSEYSQQRDLGDIPGRIVQRSDSSSYSYPPHERHDSYDLGRHGSSGREISPPYARPVVRGDSRDRGLKSNYGVIDNYYVDEIYPRGRDYDSRRSEDPYYIDRAGYLPVSRRSSRSRSPPPHYPPPVPYTSTAVTTGSGYEADDGATAFLFLRNLPVDIRVEEISLLCKRAGITTVDERDIIMPPPKSTVATKRGKQQKLTSYVHAYINFKSVDDARLIRNEFNGMMLHGYRMEVDYSLGKPSPYIRITGIRNLSAGDIERHLAEHVPPTSVVIKRSKKTGELYAGVLFASSGDATRVVKETCRNIGAVIQIDGVPVRLEYALSTDDEDDLEEFPVSTRVRSAPTSRYIDDAYANASDHYRGRGRSREREATAFDRRGDYVSRRDDYRYDTAAYPPGSTYYDDYRYHSRSRSADRSRIYSTRVYDNSDAIRGSSRDRYNRSIREDSRDRSYQGSYKAPLTATAFAGGSTSNTYKKAPSTGPKTAIAISYPAPSKGSANVINSNSTSTKRSVLENEDENQSNKRSKWSVDYSNDIDAIEEADIIAGDGNIVDTQDYLEVDTNLHIEGGVGVEEVGVGCTSEYYYTTETDNTVTYNSEGYPEQQQQQQDGNSYQEDVATHNVSESQEVVSEQHYKQDDNNNDPISELNAFYQDIGNGNSNSNSAGTNGQKNDVYVQQQQDVVVDPSNGVVAYNYQEEVFDYEEDDYRTVNGGESIITAATTAASTTIGDNGSSFESESLYDSQQVLQSYDSDYSITTANTIPGSNDWTETTIDTQIQQQEQKEQQQQQQPKQQQGTSQAYTTREPVRDYSSTKKYNSTNVTATTTASKFITNGPSTTYNNSNQRSQSSYQNSQTYRQQPTRSQEPTSRQPLQQSVPRQLRDYSQRDYSSSKSLDQPVNSARSGREYYSSTGRDYASSTGRDYASSTGRDYASSNDREYASTGREYGGSTGRDYGSSAAREYGSSTSRDYGSSTSKEYYGSSTGREYESSSYINPPPRANSSASSSVSSYGQQPSSRLGDRELPTSGKLPQSRSYYDPPSAPSGSLSRSEPQNTSRVYQDNRTSSYTGGSNTINSSSNRGTGTSSYASSTTFTNKSPIDLSYKYYDRPSTVGGGGADRTEWNVPPPSTSTFPIPVRSSKFSDATTPTTYSNIRSAEGSSQSYSDNSQYYRPTTTTQQHTQSTQQSQQQQQRINPSTVPVHQSSVPSYSSSILPYPSPSTPSTSSSSYGGALNQSTNYTHQNTVTANYNYNNSHTSSTTISPAVQINNPYGPKTSLATYAPPIATYPINNYGYHTGQLSAGSGDSNGVVNGTSNVGVNGSAAGVASGGHLIKKGY